MLPIYLVRAWKRLSERIHTLLRRYRPRHDLGDSNPNQCLEQKVSFLHLLLDAVLSLLLFIMAQLDKISDEIIWRNFLDELMKEIEESKGSEDDNKLQGRMNAESCIESCEDRTEQAQL